MVRMSFIPDENNDRGGCAVELSKDELEPKKKKRKIKDVRRRAWDGGTK